MLNEYDRLVPKLHEFQDIAGKNPDLSMFWGLSSRPEYGCQEAFSHLVQYVINLKSLAKDLISGDDNRCSHVYSLKANGEPVMILKYAKKAKYEADILREFVLTRRYLNPLRILTPNFTYAYGILAPKEPDGHFKALYEFVHGKALDVAIVNMTPRDFVGVLLQICFSLQIAQEACLLTHYDLHGSNVMVCRKPFKHTYQIDGMNYTITCNYEVKFIDFGYSFAVGSGMGLQQPGMYGACDLTHAKIYPDIFSTGFDFIKVVGFIHRVLMKYNKLKDFSALDWLWKKYIVDQYKSLKEAKECLFSISYSDPHNYLTPQGFIQELFDHSMDLCSVVSAKATREESTAPPEVFLSQIFPVCLSRTYQHYLDNSHLNSTYQTAWKRLYNWFRQIKMEVPEPKLYTFVQDELDAHYNILKTLFESTNMSKGNISSKTKEKYKKLTLDSLACTLRMSQQAHKDWKQLQRYRIYYRPVAYVNSSMRIKLKDILTVYISKFSGDKNVYHGVEYINLDEASYTRLDQSVSSLSGSRTDPEADSKEQAIEMIHEVQKRYPKSARLCQDAISLLESTQLIVNRVKYTGKLKLYCSRGGKTLTVIFAGPDEVYLDQKRRPLQELITKL